jgi:hypothetical protein
VEFGNLRVTDLQEKKILNLKFMMSHEFLYTCDTGKKGKICEESRDEKLSSRVRGRTVGKSIIRSHEIETNSLFGCVKNELSGEGE